jgi:hypothetical protein
MFVVKDAVREPLYAIVPYFNPWRWKSREKHTLRALKHFHDAGAVIILVEAAFNRRELTFDTHEQLDFADSGLHGTLAQCGIMGQEFRHKYIPLRTKDELWLKENLINIGVMSLPYDWQQVCWLDSDIHFIRPNWVGECIHKLQHYSFLQMFSQARDVNSNYEMLPSNYPHGSGNSFMEAYHSGELEKTNPWNKDSYHYSSIWPGLAWAATRKAWDDVGGLLDFAVWGGGDWHMAHAMIEKTQGMMRTDLHHNYQKLVMQWYHRCRTHIRSNVGVMEGVVLHHWHGKKMSRGYNEKHALLAKFGFDPLRHLKRDSQGLYQLHDDRSTSYVQIRDLLRVIAKERNEDSTET